nr:hypothetical protein Iba_chr04cCG9500 [Ipomoea batatas]
MCCLYFIIISCFCQALLKNKKRQIHAIHKKIRNSIFNILNSSRNISVDQYFVKALSYKVLDQQTIIPSHCFNSCTTKFVKFVWISP